MDKEPPFWNPSPWQVFYRWSMIEVSLILSLLWMCWLRSTISFFLPFYFYFFTILSHFYIFGCSQSGFEIKSQHQNVFVVHYFGVLCWHCQANFAKTLGWNINVYFKQFNKQLKRADRCNNRIKMAWSIASTVTSYIQPWHHSGEIFKTFFQTPQSFVDLKQEVCEEQFSSW